MTQPNTQTIPFFNAIPGLSYGYFCPNHGATMSTLSMLDHRGIISHIAFYECRSSSHCKWGHDLQLDTWIKDAEYIRESRESS